MAQYVARRLLMAIPVLLGILVVTFLLARMIPGDPCRSILGEKATAEACERFAELKGLNKPLPTQLGIYMADVFQGDLGDSIRFSRPVSQILVERLPSDDRTVLERPHHRGAHRCSVRHRLGYSPQLRHGSRHHDVRQRRRVDAGVLAGVDAHLRLCGPTRVVTTLRPIIGWPHFGSLL